MKLAQFRREARKAMKKNPAGQWREIGGPGHSQVRWSFDLPDGRYYLLSPKYSNDGFNSGPPTHSGWWYLSFVKDAQPVKEVSFMAKGLTGAQRKAESKMAKKNPRARRNHHLVVGEKVKLSQRGMRAHWEKERSRFTERHQNEIRDDPEWASELFSLMKREATEWRGKVAKVDKTGYLIQFIMRNGRLAKKKDYHSDKDVVSASSTTRKWPGNHFEGVDPMAKKNTRSASWADPEDMKRPELYRAIRTMVHSFAPGDPPAETNYVRLRTLDKSELIELWHWAYGQAVNRAEFGPVSDLTGKRAYGGPAWDRGEEGAEMGPIKWNPVARQRKPHLIVGERVKLSAEGIRRFPSQITGGISLSEQAREEIRGTVTGVWAWGYYIKLEGEGLPLSGNARIRAVPMKDKWMVAADSTSLDWPGNRGREDSRQAKKNGRARRNMAYPKFVAGPFGGTIQLDDKEEFDAYLASGTGAAAPAATRPPVGPAKSSHRHEPTVGGQGDDMFEEEEKPDRTPIIVGNRVMSLIGGKGAFCPTYKPRKRRGPRSPHYSHMKLAHFGMSQKQQAAFLKEMQGGAVEVKYAVPDLDDNPGWKEFLSVDGDGNPINWTAADAKEARSLARSKYGLGSKNSHQCAVGNPRLGPSPTIGHAQYYRQPTNAGPYTPQTFPYGQGGRPATYALAKTNAGQRTYAGVDDEEGAAELYAMLKKGTAMSCPKCGVRGYEPCVTPSGARTKAHAARVKKTRKYAEHLGVDPSLVARGNPQQYAIQVKQDFPGFAPAPVGSSWTSYPTYAYEQFSRSNPRAVANLPPVVAAAVVQLVAALIPLAIAAGQGQVNKFKQASIDGKIKILKKWAWLQPLLRAALQNKKFARAVAIKMDEALKDPETMRQIQAASAAGARVAQESYKAHKAGKGGLARRNPRSRPKRLRPVPSHISPTPRAAAERISAIGVPGQWPIGDLFHARLALIYAMAPNNYGKHKQILKAVERAYPQYDWAKWWNSHMAKLRMRGRKDKTFASKIELAAANPRKLSSLILS